MFGRIFGRGKDETDQAVCAQCGRTLLVGEWTQNVVGADGQEHLICSLCGQSAAFADVEPVAAGTTPANNGRVRESRSDIPPVGAYDAGPSFEADVPPETPAVAAAGVAAVAARDAGDTRDSRSESDAFWRALKEKDAEIERLQAELANTDAEKQELAGQLAAARAQLGGEAAAPGVPREPLVPAAAAVAIAAQADADADEALRAPAGAEPPRADSSEPGERTWGETPAEFATELAALRDEEAALGASPSAPADARLEAAVAAAIASENTQPIPGLGDEMIDEDIAGEAAVHPALEEAETTLTPETGAQSIAAEIGAVVASEAAAAQGPAVPEPTAAQLEAEAADLTMLQRGVDLLNVSRVPHKIADTSEQLGLPTVHVGFEGQTTVVTFLWSMGWYRFEVEAESGAIRMADRGYDERTDLRPNAGVRADGTVQLAPAQISRAAAQRAPSEPEPLAPAPSAAHGAPGPAEPEPPSVAAQKAPEILSKSLLGQRSDDDVASWEQTQAREFDWNR